MYNVFKGRLLSDPTVKQGKNGNNFTVFRVATDTQVRENPNDKYMKSFMIDVSAFGKQGEIILQHFRKGSNILVFGSLRDYQVNTGNDGKIYLNYYVTMDSFEFIDSKGSNQQQAPTTPAQVPSMQPPGIQAPAQVPSIPTGVPAGVPMPSMTAVAAPVPSTPPVPAAQSFAPAMDAATAMPAGLAGAYGM